MEVTNSKEMVMLLNVIGLQLNTISSDGKKIILGYNQQQLAYAIVGSEYDVQHVFGNTPEWLELTQYLKGAV